MGERERVPLCVNKNGMGRERERERERSPVCE